jgi:hypothetical protein
MVPFGGKRAEEFEDRIEERLSRIRKSVSAKVALLSDKLKNVLL